MMEAEEESKFRLLLISISKLLSKQNVEQLVFTTMTYIDNRNLSEECETSALKIFQAMIERDLYTFEDQSLLIQHLKLIGRHDAVKMLEQEIGASSYNNHSSEQQTNKISFKSRIGRKDTDHPKPGPSMDPGKQAARLPPGKTQAFLASSTQPIFTDDAYNPDAGTTTTPTRIQTADIKGLEPEASLFGDANSPRNLSDIPERPPRCNRGLEGCPGTPPQGSNRDMTTGYESTGSQRSPTDTLTPTCTRRYQDITERPRGSSLDTSNPLTTGFCSMGPVMATAGSIQDIPERPPRGSSPLKTTVYRPPLQESPGIVNNKQSTTRPGRPTDSDWGTEVEHGRPPPVPARPPRGHGRADNDVMELELSLLSRRFDAQVFDLFGHELGFGSGRISQLRYDHPHDVCKVFYRLMVEWRNRQQSSSNMRGNLANHLRNIGCMGLAGDLEAGLVS